MIENSRLDKKSIKLVEGKNTNWKELAKDCVAFANYKGGHILIGIEDGEDTCPSGQRINDLLIEKINKKIPQLTIGVAISAIKVQNDKGDEYISLQVFPSNKTLASTTDGKYFIRISDECKPIPPDQMMRVLADKEAFNWETVIFRNWKSDDVDQSKRFDFINSIRNSSRVTRFVKEKSDDEILDHYFFTDTGSLTNLGVLWIGRRKERAKLHYAPSIQFIKYDENEVKVKKIVWDDFLLNPKELLEEIVSLPEWQESVEISDGIFRKNIPHYDIEVIRELIANALVHRVYSMSGDIFLNLYHDRLEIHSPGSLPLGVTPQNIINKSVYRNVHLAKVFYDLKLMEKEGSGYDKVYEVLLFNGKQEPIVEEYDDRVTVTVKKEILNSEVVKLMSKVYDDIGLKQKEIIALGIIAQSNSITSIDLSNKLNIRNDDGLKNWIKGLLKSNIILSKGKTKATEYFVNPTLLKKVHFKGKTDLKKIENHRLRELILEDIKIYEPCPIGDIHDRIGSELNKKKIKRQLDSMIEDGIIVPIGVKRWRKYKLK